LVLRKKNTSPESMLRRRRCLSHAGREDEHVDQPRGFNFSNERKITVQNIVNKVIEKMDIHLESVVLVQAANETEHQCLSGEKMRKGLEWKLHYTCDKGLIGTLTWYRKFFAFNDTEWGSR
jgi:nucleoside-diphosphate-sugar epimerase